MEIYVVKERRTVGAYKNVSSHLTNDSAILAFDSRVIMYESDDVKGQEVKLTKADINAGLIKKYKIGGTHNNVIIVLQKEEVK